MGPGSHEARPLVLQMRQLDLQAALAGRRAFAKDVEDQAGAVDHLARPGTFQVALLHRRQRRIHDRDRHVVVLDGLALHRDLPLAEQRRRPAGAQRHYRGMNDHQADRGGETHRLGQPRLRRPLRVAALRAFPRQDDGGPRGGRRAVGAVAFGFGRSASRRRWQRPPPAVLRHPLRHPRPWSRRTVGSARQASRC